GSTLFPNFTGDNAFVTTAVEIGEGGGVSDNVILTFTAEVGTSFGIYAGSPDEGQSISIDWGDGSQQESAFSSKWETDTYVYYGTISGTVAGSGTVTIYGDPSELTYFEVYSGVMTSIDVAKAENMKELRLDSQSLSEIDLSGQSDLVILSLSSNALTEIDLGSNTSIETLYLDGNQLTNVDLVSNTAIETLHLEGNHLSRVDLESQTGLKTLYLSDNSELSEVVWPTNAQNLASVYALNLPLLSGSLDLTAYTSLTYVSVQNSGISSLVLGEEQFTSVFCQNNLLEELVVSSVKTTLNCSGNRLTPATLPQVSPTNYTYAPQAAYEMEESLTVGEEIDLSGLTSAGDEPTYTWKYADGTAVDENLYTVTDGVTVFAEVPEGAVYCEIGSTLFPNFTGDNAFVTTALTVIENTSSIKEASVESSLVSVYATEGRAVVENLAFGTSVSVYSLSGMKCGEKENLDGQVVFELPQGVYIIVVDKKSYKVIVF
ncbi:MAG: hypothetical protein LUI04_02680, partial [Porphyromonadaceae bacterium]|nr:hypothetical protein [Porphyromonadaceae bacterium]